ncbi:MAG: pyruvate, phosphate dikinase [Ignavibacteriae bacterium HGW-Ignavibacteriae-3]|nr:MAG: pyruvate, phosphate dikinase [Ignavibacteriae bacterium HGW-Ignavibacteriae-3]
MINDHKPIDNLVFELQERAKELNCLYTIEDSLNRSDISLRQAFHTVINAIPPAMQFPKKCKSRLIYGDIVYQTSDFDETNWFIKSEIIVQDKLVGNVAIYYLEEIPPANNGFGPFLKEEKKLLNTIADRLGHFILHHKLKNVFNEFRNVREQVDGRTKGEWRIVLDMIRKTDPNLFMSLLRKMLHLLCWKGVEEAEMLMKHTNLVLRGGSDEEKNYDDNKPLKFTKITNYDQYVETILRLADDNLPDEIILGRIQKWIQEDKSSLLIKVVDNQATSLSEIADAIRKYFHMTPEKFELPMSTIKGLRVSLLRRFFTDHLDYISVAKEYVKLTDFYDLIDKMIFPAGSHGKLGGKSAGLFLAAHILNKEAENNELLQNIKTPKTWYITSDGVLYFMRHNNLEEVLEQKYKDIDEVRIEYPHVVQLFKNSEFPPDIIKGLSVALDDLGERPLVVRSSSLLEDQIGAAFSGKYKSLFLANQGTKQQRLIALMDAIAEVYASTFSPDPIEYRAERGLLDFHEEMGVMIQEVVGTKIGTFFLPAFAGVAFSNNEFRWSPRIKREDGLLRLVPGLGTRAVDRLGDDYPVLISPGQPNLKVNISPDELIRYSPRRVDMINLTTNEFESIEINEILKEHGAEYPLFTQIFSVLEGTMIRQPNEWDAGDPFKDFYVTFDGLITNTNFLKRIETILKTLQMKIKAPVDIEFAHDGKDFYMLQCRPQSFTGESNSDVIPKDVPREKIVFTANKYISNGKVPDITHIVYVDPQKYSEISDRNKMLQVGRAISKLNKTLPKRKFILIGPGRWGSRGDIKLGVSVTYSDINNTAMLIEVARKKGNYVPDLSFGTHFFQDLVEANIRYLPLYPDDPGIIFNDKFFDESKNIFPDLLGEFKHLSEVIKVLDVKEATSGLILKVLMNSDQEQAIGLFTTGSGDVLQDQESKELFDYHPSDHWRWRMKMAEKIASEMDAERFAVKGLYVFGSTKNAASGPGSDIDLIVHIDSQKCDIKGLNLWLEGWSLALSEMNYLRTGYKAQGILDVHIVTDEDIKAKSSFAAKIDAVTDAARPLKMKQAAD